MAPGPFFYCKLTAVGLPGIWFDSKASTLTLYAEDEEIQERSGMQP